MIQGRRFRIHGIPPEASLERRNEGVVDHGGLTKRDWFAGMALVGGLSVLEAFRMADAMIEEANK